MRLDLEPFGRQLLEIRPTEGVSSRPDIIGVDEQGCCEAQFFENRISVLRKSFVAVVKAQHHALSRQLPFERSELKELF